MCCPVLLPGLYNTIIEHDNNLNFLLREKSPVLYNTYVGLLDPAPAIFFKLFSEKRKNRQNEVAKFKHNKSN